MIFILDFLYDIMGEMYIQTIGCELYANNFRIA